MEWPWLYFLVTFLFSVVTGVAIFSKGSVFQTLQGQVLQGVLSIISLGFIGWAFWTYGGIVGCVELFIVFFGAGLGKDLLTWLLNR